MLHSACGACLVTKSSLFWPELKPCLGSAPPEAGLSVSSYSADFRSPGRSEPPLVNRASVPCPFCLPWYLCRKTIKLLEMSQRFRAKSKPTAPDCSLTVFQHNRLPAGKFKQMLLRCQSFNTGTKQTSWFNTAVSYTDIQITGLRHEGTSLNKSSGEKNQAYLEKEAASKFPRNFAARWAGLPGKGEAIRR